MEQRLLNNRKDRFRSFLAAVSTVTAVFLAEYVVWFLLGDRNPFGVVLLVIGCLALAMAVTVWVVGCRLPDRLAIFLSLLLPGALLGFQAATVTYRGNLESLFASVIGALVFAAVGGKLVTRSSVRLLAYSGTVVLGIISSLIAAVDSSQLPWFPPQKPKPDRKDKPSVMLVVLDTTRRDHLTVYGYGKPTSPNLHKLSSTSQVYNQAWSPAPWTPPSHASMLTGLLPGQHGCDGRAQPKLATELVTIQEVLKDQGYATAGFVANPNLHATGWDQGFDRYEGPVKMGRHSSVVILNRILFSTTSGWAAQNGTEVLLRRARRWWTDHEHEPRFLFINLIDPHRPYSPSPRQYDRIAPSIELESALKTDQDPVTYYLRPGVSVEQMESLNALYDAEIRSMDEQLGQFFAWVSARGELDETLVIVTADHGERLGERGLVGHDLLMDSYLLHVPLIIRFPVVLESGQVDYPVRLDGLPQFILGLLGLPSADRLFPREFRIGDDEFIVAQYQQPDWFLEQLRNADPGFETDPFEGDWNYVSNGHFTLLSSSKAPDAGILIKMDDSTDWTTDQSSAYPDIAAALREYASQLPKFSNHQTEETVIDPSQREQLRELGYVD